MLLQEEVNHTALHLKDQNSKPLKKNTAFERFSYGIDAVQTREYYYRKMRKFLDFADISYDDSFEKRVNCLYEKIQSNGIDWFSEILLDFIISLKAKVSSKEITGGTLRNYYKPIKLFCDMNDILLNWKFVTRGIPCSKRAAFDRAPTIEEVHKLIDSAEDVRIKPLVLLMLSTGIRLGAWDYLKWKHISPIKDETGRIIAAKLLVYAGEPEQYITYMTSEAYGSITEWIDLRRSHGENVTQESWVMRDRWRTADVKYAARLGLAVYPRQLKSGGIRSLISHAYFKQGIRPILKEGQKRHEFKALHGFRKFFKTQCEQVMKPANVELLMGRDLGLSQSYYKPTEQQLLEDYLRAAEAGVLTINREFVLSKEIEKQKIKNMEYSNLISNKLQEKDQQINSLMSQFSRMKIMVDRLMTALSHSEDQNQVNAVAKSLLSSGIIDKSA
jgi:hypothetical protein